MPDTIAVRNPHVINVAEDEMRQGAGRNLTEVAENLIMIGAETRRIERGRRNEPNGNPIKCNDCGSG